MEGESGTTSGIVWEGMTEMTVLTKAPESQFAYVVLAARRARQLMAGAPPMVENPRTQKATRIACEELENSLLEYDFVEPASIDTDKDGNKRRK
jgi:DNA-directed RNA polymerase omega subunit